MGTAVGLSRGAAVVTEGVAVVTDGEADVASMVAHDLLVATRGNVAREIEMSLHDDPRSRCKYNPSCQFF